MAELKKVSDGVFQFACDCGEYIHTLKATGEDGKVHIETKHIPNTQQENDNATTSKKKPARGFFEELGI